MPPREKPAMLMVKLPAPMVRATAAVTKLRLLEKSTLFCTQMRPPVAAIRPKRTMVSPPSTPRGMVWINAPKNALFLLLCASSRALLLTARRVFLSVLRFCLVWFAGGPVVDCSGKAFVVLLLLPPSMRLVFYLWLDRFSTRAQYLQGRLLLALSRL